jgi:hypothetical protein
VRIVSTEQAALGIETGVVVGWLENAGAEAGCMCAPAWRRCCVSSAVRSVRRSTKMKPMVRIAVAGVQQCALGGCMKQRELVAARGAMRTPCSTSARARARVLGLY